MSPNAPSAIDRTIPAALRAVMIGLFALLAACAEVIPVHNPGPPPPLKRETMGEAPYPGAHWVHGNWVWRHGQWEWVPGHWAHIHW